MLSLADVPKLVSGVAQEFWMEIQQSERPPLPSIALFSNSKPKVLMKTEAGTLERAVELSHETAQKMSRLYAVVVEAWDGYAITDGDRRDAILLNVWVEGRGPLFFLQRYRRDPFELTGGTVDGTDASALQR